MLRIILTIIAYAIATFVVQATSHFALNADHYKSIPIMRAEPVLTLGITSMVIQGFLFAVLFPSFNRRGSSIRNGLLFSWSIGLFLLSYIALAEAGKYAIPSIARWITVETISSAAQFTLFGILLGLIHKERTPLPVEDLS